MRLPRCCAPHPMAMAALLLLAAPRIAGANGAEVGFDAGTIVPVNSTAIQLVSETVVIRLAPGAEAWTDTIPNAICTYVLRNPTGEPQTFSMAFVTNDPISPTESESWADHYRRARFAVRQDGQAREVRYTPGSHAFSEYGAAPPHCRPGRSRSDPGRPA